MGVFLPLLSMSQITPISISESYTLNRNDEWLSLKQVKIAIAGASTPAVIARPTDNIECAIEILSTHSLPREMHQIFLRGNTRLERVVIERTLTRGRDLYTEHHNSAQ